MLIYHQSHPLSRFIICSHLKGSSLESFFFFFAPNSIWQLMPILFYNSQIQGSLLQYFMKSWISHTPQKKWTLVIDIVGLHPLSGLHICLEYAISHSFYVHLFPPAVPSAPPQLSIASTSPTDIRLMWHPLSSLHSRGAITRYRIEYSTLDQGE